MRWYDRLILVFAVASVAFSTVSSLLAWRTYGLTGMLVVLTGGVVVELYMFWRSRHAA